jgi:hypothetical protein
MADFHGDNLACWIILILTGLSPPILVVGLFILSFVRKGTKTQKCMPLPIKKYYHNSGHSLRGGSILGFYQKQIKWINPAIAGATKSATAMFGWATVALRSRYGQHHNSFLYNH